MSNLETELIVQIIDKLEEKGDPYFPVSHLAKELGCDESSGSGCASLSTRLVVHLLHLEDLGCIENMLRKTSWGYVPQAHGLEISHDQPWATPHCYLGNDADSAIRITANARQLREALNDATLTVKSKQFLLSAGEGAISDFLKTKVAQLAVAALSQISGG